MSLLQFIRPTDLTYSKRTHEAEDIYTFSFKPTTALTWRAGQHGLLEVSLPNGKTTRRMFSLSSAPSEGIVSITTHWLGDDKASDFKKALWHLKPGDSVRLRGPLGPMYIRNPDQQNIFIAGGIGITPFRSILVEAASETKNLQGALLYSSRSRQSMIFKSTLQDIAEQLPNFEANFTTESNHMNSQAIESIVKNNAKATFYIAGPPKMVKSINKELRALGVSSSHIKKDRFFGYK